MTKPVVTNPDGDGGADPAVQAVAHHALGLVPPGAILGLGTGRAAAAFIAVLATRVRDGFKVIAVPTSGASERQARALGIPIGSLDDGQELDLTVDGADEVAPNLDLVKGRGGALVRERIVAAASRQQVILVAADKLVSGLGARGPIPVEIIPMARTLVLRRMSGLGLRVTVHWSKVDGAPAVSENGNLTLDCTLATPLDTPEAARALEAALLAIPGVVDTGLFLGTATRVLIGHPDGRVEILGPRQGITDRPSAAATATPAAGDIEEAQGQAQGQRQGQGQGQD